MEPIHRYLFYLKKSHRLMDSPSPIPCLQFRHMIFFICIVSCRSVSILLGLTTETFMLTCARESTMYSVTELCCTRLIAVTYHSVRSASTVGFHVTQQFRTKHEQMYVPRYWFILELGNLYCCINMFLFSILSLPVLSFGSSRSQIQLRHSKSFQKKLRRSKWSAE